MGKLNLMKSWWAAINIVRVEESHSTMSKCLVVVDMYTKARTQSEIMGGGAGGGSVPKP